MQYETFTAWPRADASASSSRTARRGGVRVSTGAKGLDFTVTGSHKKGFYQVISRNMGLGCRALETF